MLQLYLLFVWGEDKCINIQTTIPVEAYFH